jgi:hypothetical protein
MLHIDDFRMYVSFVCLNSGMIAHGHVDIKYALRTTIMLALVVIARLHFFVWLLITTKFIWSSYVLEIRKTLNRFCWSKHCHYEIFTKD